MYFIVSTGRCGSMTIADYLNQSCDTICFHEPEPVLTREAYQYQNGKLSQQRAMQILLETRSASIDGKQYGESNLNLSQLIPALHEAFPDARFLWLIRDGRDTVTSFFSRKWYAPMMGPQHRRDFYTRQWELYRPRGDQVGQMSWWTWNGLSTFEKCCWHWTYINQLIKDSLTASGCEWQQIRIEDLDEKGPALFDFLKLTPPEHSTVKQLNRANRNLGQNPINWRNWSPEQIRAFRLFCADAMDAWYPEWQAEWKLTEEKSAVADAPSVYVRLARAIIYPAARCSVVQSIRIKDKYRRLFRRQQQLFSRARQRLWKLLGFKS